MKQTKKQIKKISTATIETINRLSPDELEAHDIIQRARASGYVCPLCGSGEGSHGTGMALNKKIETHTSFTCFSGSHSFNVLKLCALHYGLDTRANYPQLVEKICADFNIPIEYDEFSLNGGKRSSKQQSKRREPISPEELKKIQDDLNTSTDPLKTFMKYQPNQKWRGFDFEFLVNHGCRLINDWFPPKTRGTNQQPITATMRMIVPAGEASYLARLVDQTKNYDIKARPFIKEKVHAGRKELFNPDALNSDEPIFCFEGFFDAMSAELAGFKAVALGGRGESYLLIDAIDKLKNKPQIIILFDSDKAGRESAPELRDNLLQIKCPCVVRFLSEPKKDYTPTEGISGNMVLVENKIDANEILQKQGINVLRAILQNILNNSLAELNAVEAEIAKKDEAGLSSEDWDFIFSGSHHDLDFARRLERFCALNVRWLTDDERWMTYQNGVWLRGSEKNSCISPFARRLAEAMTFNADDKNERELASKFQSAKKINNAITLLKSFDSILISSLDLNNHPELLNCLNCVVDLSDGKSYPHAPELLLSQQIQAAYYPDAQSNLVDKFFVDIMPDEMTRAGLLRWLGYCLTGENSAEKFMIWHGLGKNGKGVLSATILALLGAYGVGLTPRALLKNNRPVDANAATVALNALEGARFAISEEMPADGELDVSLIKNLTGGDRINLRRNYGEYRTITNATKLNLSGNYLPKIENISDFGLLRRILNMPFTVQFGTAEHPSDDQLKKKLLLADNLNALLTLLVAEAIAWYRGNDGGLIISDVMKQETARHLSQNDFVEEFISDNYELNPKHEIKAKDLIDALKREYPRETNRFKRADLIKLIESVEGVTYEFGRTKTHVFKGIAPLAK
ncbi:MAG: toprim domain-containing protein [Selenomonadaceae bacterium]|nr:toprim domain-containing protein [Selenomonadaceae bacterium]